MSNKHDPVNHPSHYCSDPSGVECIDITENWDFLLGNVLKYIWRHGKKSSAESIEDLEKARWYLDRKIQKIKSEQRSKKIDAYGSDLGDEREDNPDWRESIEGNKCSGSWYLSGCHNFGDTPPDCNSDFAMALRDAARAYMSWPKKR